MADEMNTNQQRTCTGSRVFITERALECAQSHRGRKYRATASTRDWFAPLASAEVVASEWVNRELGHSLKQNRVERMLPDGSWDSVDGDSTMRSFPARMQSLSASATALSTPHHRTHAQWPAGS
jgi:hypothetical protein